MKKRFLCAILALIMMISLVPVTAMTASAASMKTSDAAIKFIKQYESYNRTCYKDGDRYSIGYGTLCDKDHTGGKTHTIEEIDASEALAEELPEIEEAVNSMGLSLTQSQFDALVSFSYNNGTAWIYGNGIWKSAVTGKKTGNDFLYAIGLWSNDSAGFSYGLMKRRLAEANMYLNGIYDKNPPANYTYVLFDANGGTLTNSYDTSSYKMQAFIKGGSVAIKASAKRTGYTFMGWYTAKSGGERVTSLTSAAAGKTLYALWQSTENPQEVKVSYTIPTSALASTTVYDAVNGKVWAAQAAAASGETVKIIREMVDEQGVRWGRIENSGWVKIAANAVIEDNETESPVIGAGIEVTVTNAYINLRPEPVATGAVLGKVYYGEKLTLLEVKTSHGALWGKTAKGWIALMYTDYDPSKVEVEQNPETDTVKMTGTVSLNQADSHLFIRSTPDATNNSNLTGKILKHGDKVEVYETTLVNGVSWGRIATGWICLTYVKNLTEVTPDSETGTDGSESTEKPEAEKIIATGTVISNTPLNVRSKPSTVNNYPIASKVKGTVLNIYEIVSVDDSGKIVAENKAGSHKWGRINTGTDSQQWVCLDYVNFTMLEVEEEDKNDSTTTPGTSGSAMFTGKTTSGVNIRKDADGTSEIVGKIPNGESIAIQELTLGTDTANGKGWAKVTYTDKDKKTVNGWVYMGNVALDPVNYEVICKSLNVRPNPGTAEDNKPTDKLANGTVVEISKIIMPSATSMWGYSEKYNGWMCITANYMKRTAASVDTGSGDTDGSEDDSSSNVPSTGTPSGFTGTGVVNGAQLNIRSGPGMGYPSSGKLMPGSEIRIYEYATNNGAAWGRTDYGWVCLSYVLITSTDMTGAGQKATVANTYIGVNVRSDTSTVSAILTKIMVNSRVEILETKTVNGSNWGRTSLGWVSMDYILLDSAVGGDIEDIINGGAAGGTTGGDNTTSGGTTGGTTVTGATYAGKVTEATDIYKEFGSATVVGNKLAKDQAITVYELKAADNGVVWARVGEGWIKSANTSVKLNAIKQDYTVVSTTLNVRSTADASVSNVVAQLKEGDVVEVTELEISAAAGVWGKVSYKNAENVTVIGYISLGAKYVAVGDLSVKEETPAPDAGTNNNGTTGGTGTVTPPATVIPNTNPSGILYTGTVDIWDGTAAKLKVRDTAGGKEIDSLSPGVKVNIVQTTVVNNMPWGKCGAGWICLTYVDLVPYNSNAIDARVVLYANSVNIYEGAGAHYNTVGTYAKGTVVDILEINGGWARTSQGWIETAYLAP